MRKKIKIKNEKLVFAILIIALFVIFLLYYNLVISVVFARNSYANQVIAIADDNEKTVFNVQKVLLYSSATATSDSKEQALKDMSISQFTDISIYLDNTGSSSQLVNENTIKELYIDNISIKSNNDELGTKVLNYKNPLDFGKYVDIEEPQNGRIDFNIVNTNNENENSDYSKPTFYTDCSNPITLGYENKEIVKNYSVSDDQNSVSYNGKILKKANVNINDINYTLSFTINIVNNLNEKFVYNMNLDVDLNDENGGIYNGYVYKNTATSGLQYRFFRSF